MARWLGRGGCSLRERAGGQKETYGAGLLFEVASTGLWGEREGRAAVAFCRLWDETEFEPSSGFESNRMERMCSWRHTCSEVNIRITQALEEGAFPILLVHMSEDDSDDGPKRPAVGKTDLGKCNCEEGSQLLAAHTSNLELLLAVRSMLYFSADSKRYMELLICFLDAPAGVHFASYYVRTEATFDYARAINKDAESMELYYEKGPEHH